MNPIEKAYRAWRATVPDFTPTYVIGGGTPAVVISNERPRRAKTVNGPLAHLSPERRSEIARNAVMTRWAKSRRSVGSGRYERTAAHKEILRAAALKRWAKVRRSA